MLKSTAVTVVTTVLLTASCQAASSNEVPVPKEATGSSTTSVTFERTPETLTTEPAPLTGLQLREITFSREDFPYEWTSAPPVEDDLSGTETGAETESYDVESCLGLEVGTLDTIASLESDTFTYDGSFEIRSYASQHRDENAASAEFNALLTTAGRECLRQAARQGASAGLPAGVAISDVFASECAAIPGVVMETACVLMDFLVTADASGSNGVSIQSEIHGLVRDNVTVFVIITWFPDSSPDEVTLAELGQAIYALAGRFAVASLS